MALSWLALTLLAGPAAALLPGGPWLGVKMPGPSESGSGPGAPGQQPRIRALNLSVPVDHFHNDSRYEPHSDGRFNLQYWVDTSRYRPGGPVIVLLSGESPGEDRLPFLEYGIAALLAEATGGIGVVLEHRYYGNSMPVADTTVQNLRFLTTDQALADTAYFARHARFPGLERRNLTAGAAPYILYGGSYAGAFAALARKLYPDVFWGAISSSGVTAAVDDFWEYLEAARRYAPGLCSPAQQQLMYVVDSMLLGRAPANPVPDHRGADADADADADLADAPAAIKALFGLEELLDDEFAGVLARGITGLQATNWDPDLDDSEFGTYCATITSEHVLFASTAHLRPAVSRIVARAGFHGAHREALTAMMLNLVGYMRTKTRDDMASECRGQTLRQCYSSRLAKDRTDQHADTGRSWQYQMCTQWGYFLTGSGVPSDRLPLVPRALTYEYATTPCRLHFNITARPDVESINRHGGLHFSYPRLAFVDGAQDPWRAAGPHAVGLRGRPSTPSEPFLLIDWGVHHWDENGLSREARHRHRMGQLPPRQVADAQREEVLFVKAWLREWSTEHAPEPLELEM